ncbi:MAG TPA: hypothetical protein VEA37_02235, partial [Flavobacterium sp.]|nr:hypothetical protein [Flavobacterium sp.]
MKIGEIRQKFKELDFRQITGDALEATKSEIVEYQKAQMLHGEDVNGGKIGKYKSKDYARRKFNMNPLAGYGNVDLRYKG